eukprot:TRINITY_DN6500_c0_g2_i1.p1 TRINITY_DN6500_c0_g2~~TRINITY_DN6500_c0_g2_i1.p1  ORF type:complete len:1162 (+),score=210.33 TRINITY_DN6500_c0_g2_i1:107-3592(+)
MAMPRTLKGPEAVSGQGLQDAAVDRFGCKDSAMPFLAAEASEPEAVSEPEAEDTAVNAREVEERPAAPTRTPTADGRLECEFCGRKFNPSSYERHQPVCQKVFGGTRPQFIPSYVVAKAPAKSTAIRSRQPVASGASSPISPVNSSLKARVSGSTGSSGAGMSTMLSSGGRHHSSALQLGSRSGGSGVSSVRTLAQPAKEEQPLTGNMTSEYEEEEQRLHRVMSEQMAEIRSMRKSVCEEDLEPPPAPPEPDEPEQLLWQPTTSSAHQDAASPRCREQDVPKQSSGVHEPDAHVGARRSSLPAAISVPHPEDVPKQSSGVHEPDAHVGARRSSLPAAISVPHPEDRLLPPPRNVDDDQISSALAGTSTSGRATAPLAMPSEDVELLACEDCGRRFNPASLEKHRAVCRSVFGGKNSRSTFESHTQRLRGVKAGSHTPPRPLDGQEVVAQGKSKPAPAAAQDVPRVAPAAAPRRRARVAAVVEASTADSTPTSSSSTGPARQFSGQVHAAAAKDRSAGAANISPRGVSPMRSNDLCPCPHCGRSFRPAVVEKHVKVCQSVFPTHDTPAGNRRVYDSRLHRLKGTPFEAFAAGHDGAGGAGAEVSAPPFAAASRTSAAERRVSSTPPRNAVAAAAQEVRTAMPPPPAGRFAAGRGGSGPMLPVGRVAEERGISSGSPQTHLRRSVSELLVPQTPPRNQECMRKPCTPIPAAEEPALIPENSYVWEEAEEPEEGLTGVPEVPLRNEEESDSASFTFGSSIEPGVAPSFGQGVTQAPPSLPTASPLQAFRTLEDRATLLERARLGVKMGQRPEHALLAGSLSEAVLRQPSSDRRHYTAAVQQPAASQIRDTTGWQAGGASPKIGGASPKIATCAPPPMTAMRPEASPFDARGSIDTLSRSQPSVPTLLGEAPLSSRSQRRLGEVSPQRRSSGALAHGGSIRLPFKSREDSEERRPLANVARGLGSKSPQLQSRASKVKPGLCREDTASSRSSCGGASPIQSACGTSSPASFPGRASGAPQRSPRQSSSQWQASLGSVTAACAVPWAPQSGPPPPPPSPSTVRRQQLHAASLEMPISPRAAAAAAVAQAAGLISPRTTISPRASPRGSAPASAWLPQAAMVASPCDSHSKASTPPSATSTPLGVVVPRLDLRKAQQMQQQRQQGRS